MSKPTKNEFKSLLDKTFPITGSDPTANSLVKIQRAACETMLDQLDDFFKKDETEYLEGLRRSLVAENDKLKKEKEALLVQLADKKIEISEKDKEIADLKTAKVEAEHKLEEAKYRYDNADRIIKNRTDAVIAKANERLREVIPPDIQKELDDYSKLLSSAVNSEKLDLSEYSTRWRVLTRRIIDVNKNSPRFALFARANGNYIMTRWNLIVTLTGSPKRDGFDQSPFTHYMTIPKTSLEYLLGAAQDEEEGKEEPDEEDGDDKCKGCPHFVDDPNAPNTCVLPDCIKDYDKKRYNLGQSSNTVPV